MSRSVPFLAASLCLACLGCGDAFSAADATSPEPVGQGGGGGEGGGWSWVTLGLSTTSSGTGVPVGGTVGSGGEGGGAGEGGAAPCEPTVTCADMPPGACGTWTDDCGTALLCDGAEACGVLSCDVGLGVCVCGDASSYGAAVAACPGAAPFFCGEGGEDVPEGCSPTGIAVGGPTDWVWCCEPG